MLRWIGRIFSFVVLLVLVGVGLIALMPADQVARIAADQLRSATGREVTVSGDVSITLWPVVGASVGSLEIGNADWSQQGPMLTAQNVAIGLETAALLRGDIRITHLEATSPTIRLESRKDGRVNWQFTDATGAVQVDTAPEPSETTSGTARPLSIRRLEIDDATLIYDAEGAELVTMAGVDLALDWPERTGPVQIDAVLRPAGTPVAVAARIDAFADFVAGATRGVDVSVKAAQGSLRFTGQAAVSGVAEGDVSVAATDTGGFLRSLGLSGADLPAGLGKSLELAAKLDLSADRKLSLRGLDADLGAGNRLRGTAEVALDGVPRIDANLTAGALNLRSLSEGGGAPGGGGQTGGGSAASGWSTAPIDASGLAAFDGEIALSAESVDLGDLALGSTRVVLRNDNSRMVATLQEVMAYGGTVTGEFVANNRSGLSVGGRMTGTGLQLQGLLSDLAGITRLTGAAQAELQFLGVGQSLDAIMRSLSGKGAVSVGRGTIEGIDLDRLMRSGDMGAGTTVFDSLTASYTMEGGNLRNDDLLMSLPAVEARGAGRVGLGARDLDYLFTPKALRVNDGRGLSIPVRIRGPWSSPRIESDLEAAIDLNFKEERQKAEREIREKVESKVARELGVAPEEGQSVEDAIEKKLEKELGRSLKRLFD